MKFKTRIRYFIFLLVFIFVAKSNFVFSQCNSYTEVQNNPSITSIICWQFARAYLYENEDFNSSNIPTLAQMQKPEYDVGNFCNDSDFVETTDFSKADVVIWGHPTKVGHIAVALGDGTFISKEDGRSIIEIHELCRLNNPVTKFYIFKDREEGLGISNISNCGCYSASHLTLKNCASSASDCSSNFTGTLNQSPLQPYNNYVQNYYNVITITNTDCQALTWTKTGGSGNFYSNASGMNVTVYLSSNQNISLKVLSDGGSWSKNYTIHRNSSGYKILKDGSEKTYPNPFKDHINLSSSLINKRVEIFNIEGRKIKTFIYDGNELDMASYPSGLYLIRGFNFDEVIFEKKIIKN